MGKVFDWIKDKWNKAKAGMAKAGGWIKEKLPIVSKIASGIAGGLAMLPGKVGLIGKVVHGIGSVFGAATDKLPEGAVKDKLKDWGKKAEEKSDEALKKADQFAGKAAKYGDAAGVIINKLQPKVALEDTGQKSLTQPLLQKALK